MSNEDKLEPFVFANVLGQDVKIQYTMRAAKVFKRLTGDNLLGSIDFNDPDHMVAFWVAGLVQHQRSLVGEVDAEGKPNAIMQRLIDQLDDRNTNIEDLSKFSKPFLTALAKAQPAIESSSHGEAKSSKKK